MLQTISIGTHIQIQGLFVRRTTDGQVVVSVGNTQYKGKLIKRMT